MTDSVDTILMDLWKEAHANGSGVIGSPVPFVAILIALFRALSTEGDGQDQGGVKP